MTTTAGTAVFDARGLAKVYRMGDVDVPTSGTVRYRDHDLTAADESALTLYRCEPVGFVFQFYNLIPSLTAREAELLSGLSEGDVVLLHPGDTVQDGVAVVRR